MTRPSVEFHRRARSIMPSNELSPEREQRGAKLLPKPRPSRAALAAEPILVLPDFRKSLQALVVVESKKTWCCQSGLDVNVDGGESRAGAKLFKSPYRSQI